MKKEMRNNDITNALLVSINNRLADIAAILQCNGLCSVEELAAKKYVRAVLKDDAFTFLFNEADVKVQEGV